MDTGVYKFVQTNKRFHFADALDKDCPLHKNMVPYDEDPIAAGSVTVCDEGFQIPLAHSDSLEIGMTKDTIHALEKELGVPFKEE